MSELLTKKVGECPFCTKGDEDKRYVKKVLRDGGSEIGLETEYRCGVGQNCILVKLYKWIDEADGNKNREEFY